MESFPIDACYNLGMTKLLEQAFAKATALSEPDQDAIARLLMDEIDSERRWDELFTRSPGQLRKLADDAWAEHEAGHSELLDPDTL